MRFVPQSKEALPVSPRPDPRAELRAFAAMVLEMARVDPTRPPSAEVCRWHRDLASVLEIIPETVETNRAMVDEALRIHRMVRRRAEQQITA
jgi:hypothetical protein